VYKVKSVTDARSSIDRRIQAARRWTYTVRSGVRNEGQKKRNASERPLWVVIQNDGLGGELCELCELLL